MTGTGGTRLFQSARASLLLLSMAALLLALPVILSLKKGTESVLGQPLGTRAQQLASAISDTAYGLRLQHGFHTRIADTLLKGGMSGQPKDLAQFGLASPPYGDAAHWNALLLKAATLQGIEREPTVADRTLSFIYAEDHGMVEFYKLSFHLFGYKIEGFFATYFLLLASSVALLFVVFWSRPGILACACLLLGGLFCSILALNNAEYNDVTTVSSGRFMNTLVVIPAFHLAVLVWRASPFSLARALATLAQVLLLAFVIWMRGAALWAALFLLLCALLFVAWQVRLGWSSLVLRDFFRRAFTWPLILIVLGFAFAGYYQRAKTHPAYYALDELRAGHFFWHSLAYGLGLGERLGLGEPESIIPELAGQRADEVGKHLGSAYLKRIIGFDNKNPSIYFASDLFPEWGRMKSYERVLQHAYLDLASENREFMLRLTAIKLYDSVTMHYHWMRTVLLQHGRLLALLGCLFLVIVVIAVPRSAPDSSDFLMGVTLTAGLAATAAAPGLVAYPYFAAAGDAFALWGAAVVGCVLGFVLLCFLKVRMTLGAGELQGERPRRIEGQALS